MTNIEHERLAALARKAAALQQVWLREREEQRTIQVIANSEIRRRWVESDLSQAVALTTDQRSVTIEQAGRSYHRDQSGKVTRS